MFQYQFHTVLSSRPFDPSPTGPSTGVGEVAMHLMSTAPAKYAKAFIKIWSCWTKWFGEDSHSNCLNKSNMESIFCEIVSKYVKAEKIQETQKSENGKDGIHYFLNIQKSDGGVLEKQTLLQLDGFENFIDLTIDPKKVRGSIEGLQQGINRPCPGHAYFSEKVAFLVEQLCGKNSDKVLSALLDPKQSDALASKLFASPKQGLFHPKGQYSDIDFDFNDWDTGEKQEIVNLIG